MRSARLPFLAGQRRRLHGTFDNQASLAGQTKRRETNEYGGNAGAALAIGALVNTVERLEQLLDLENAALRDNRLAALEDFSQKKSQALLELHRTASTIGELHSDRLGVDH
jgi:hypothetical protein